jgi:hypothetical protein
MHPAGGSHDRKDRFAMRHFDWFFKPGDMVCDLIRLEKPDDRQVMRVFANMIIWGAVVVVFAIIVA